MKKSLKKTGIEVIADQSGKLFDPDILTIIWARRFAGYKRADLLTRNMEKFNRLINNKKYPIQMVWAGKPYPLDYPAISEFNYLVNLSKEYNNIAVCIGYELSLSKWLKQTSDVWINNPRVPREASGTSGMTAAMNGSVNLSTNDGWIREFIKHGVNGYVVPLVDYENMSVEDQDMYDADQLFNILEKEILPTYYDDKNKWHSIVENGMLDVRLQFDSNRMAKEYYEILYQ